MSEMEKDEVQDSVVILTDDEGNDIEFEFLDLIHYEDHDYVVLLPTDPEDMDDGVVILQVVKGKEETYIDIEDDEVLDKVFAIFKDRYDGEYDFEEE